MVENEKEYEALIDKILEALELIRPFLIKDGGDVEFVDIKESKVYIRLTGNCATCAMSDSTLKLGIERSIKDKVPTISEVINITDY